jgi:hypothetical protein
VCPDRRFPPRSCGRSRKVHPFSWAFSRTTDRRRDLANHRGCARLAAQPSRWYYVQCPLTDSVDDWLTTVLGRRPPGFGADR